MRITTWSGAALCAAVLVAACSGNEPSSEPDADPSPTVPSSATPGPGEIGADGLPVPISVADAGGETIDAGPDNDFAIAAAGGIWVTGVPPGIVRYDASSGEITHRVRLASAVVQALDATAGRVWITGLEPDVLLTLDETSGEVVGRVDLPAAPVPESSVAAHGDVAWVLVDHDAPRIVRVDTASGRITPLPALEGPEALRYGAGALWVSTYDSVERLDPGTGRVLSSIPTGPGSSFLTFDSGAVWVLGQLDGTVYRVDAGTEEVTEIATSDVSVNGGDIAAGDGFVWSRTWEGVTIVDAGTEQAVARIGTEGGSGSVAAADGWLWITDHDHSAVHRVPWPPE